MKAADELPSIDEVESRPGVSHPRLGHEIATQKIVEGLDLCHGIQSFEQIGDPLDLLGQLIDPNSRFGRLDRLATLRVDFPGESPLEVLALHDLPDRSVQATLSPVFQTAKAQLDIVDLPLAIRTDTLEDVGIAHLQQPHSLLGRLSHPCAAS